MDLTDGGRRFADLCRDLYALAQGANCDAAGVRGPERGWSWEARVADALSRRGFPVEPLPGGVRVFGAVPASGLRHQTDAAVHCADAHVVGEWKSYSGAVPKNELLRFKAATDDLYDALSVRLPRRPVLRLFGVAGDASPQLRWYAARHGIALIERSRWPAPVLADPALPWPDAPRRAGGVRSAPGGQRFAQAALLPNSVAPAWGQLLARRRQRTGTGRPDGRRAGVSRAWDDD